LNKVPFVPNNESLLGILDKFQEGRSHMAIVSRFSADKAASVKQAVKRSLTQRLRHRVGISDDSSDSGAEENISMKSDSKGSKHMMDKEAYQEHDKEATLRGNGNRDKGYDTAEDEDKPKLSIPLRSRKGRRKSRGAQRDSAGPRGKNDDIEMGVVEVDDARQKTKAASFTTLGLEQVTPADAVLAKDVVEDVSYLR
jgi:metal transporter CNNM